MTNSLTFYTHPMSRGRIARWMLEEVQAEYDTVVMELGKKITDPEFLAMNPMGKVPVILHDGVVVTECAAICAYLADAFPDRDLAPPARRAGPLLPLAAVRCRLSGTGGHQPGPRRRDRARTGGHGGLSDVRRGRWTRSSGSLNNPPTLQARRSPRLMSTWERNSDGAWSLAPSRTGRQSRNMWNGCSLVPRTNGR